MNLSQLKAQADSLGITEAEARAHGNTNHKATWEKAIRYAQSLQAEAEEENRQARLQQIYNSPGAALIVPVAGTAAYFQGLGRAVKRCF